MKIFKSSICLSLILILCLINLILPFNIVFGFDDTSSYIWSSGSYSDSILTSSEVSTEITENPLNLECGSAILIEQKTGQILYSHNIHEQLRPASVTKVMSILLIMEAISNQKISLTDMVPCSENASSMGGSQIWLDPRETLSVESLFKKVRKTVYNLTNGTQTPWEHTSLIGDFFFNTGQLVYSVEIPYDEHVVKDSLFNEGDVFGNLISELRSCDWNRQNPAMEKICRMPASDLNKNQQFILGRNLYQANGYAWKVQTFFENLEKNLSKYNKDKENHVLNGILFEIYFNNKGDFRNELKKHDFDRVFLLRKNPIYAKSFEFIRNVLQPYKEQLFYIPAIQDEPIDIDISAEEKKDRTSFGEDTIQIIHKVNVENKDITKAFARYCSSGINESGVKSYLSNFLTAPQDLIQIHSNVSLQKISFAEELLDEDILWQ